MKTTTPKIIGSLYFSHCFFMSGCYNIMVMAGQEGNITRIHQGVGDRVGRLFNGQVPGPSVAIDRVTPQNDLPSVIDLTLARRRPTKEEAIRILTPVEPPPPDGAA